MKKLVCLLLALVLLVSVIPMAALAAEETVSNEMAVNSVTLRTLEGKEGMYYGASFKLSADTVAKMTADVNACYGLALATTQPADNQAWTDGLNGTGAVKVLRSTYSFNEAPLTANVTKKVNSTSLVNIININNETLTNLRNAATVVYVRPYYQANGEFTFGAIQACSMQDVAEMVDDYYNETKNGVPYLNDTQKKGLLGMYERFSITMDNWDMPKLIADYEAGNPLILEYRRDKVVANMIAQTDILWSFEGESFQYSRTANSNGIETDKAKEVYTLHPGKIYKGLPYTHGSTGVQAMMAMGQLIDGVYVIPEEVNLNTSFFSGGSTNGSSASSGQYNVARLGNDCWDAIHWAYETVGSSVTANQTQMMTPDYGMYPVGGEYSMDAGLTPSSDGRKGFLINYQRNEDGTIKKDENGNALYNPGGTQLICEAYKDDPQVMFRAYAAMLPGDALVQFNNSQGHSLMCMGVSVAYNDDGTINPDESYFTFADQSSGPEKAQSEFTGYDESEKATYSHRYFHILGGNTKTCAECVKDAGVPVEKDENGRVIWDLCNRNQSYTFREAFETAFYIPVTPIELTSTAAPTTARISDAKNTSNVAKLFEGELTSSYRISHITLDIYDANGAKVNASTCFGIQSGVESGFALSRFTSDTYVGQYGSVLKGVPGLIRQRYNAQYAQQLDENGALVTKTVEAGTRIYQYTELKDADGNIVYRTQVNTETGETENVLDADGNPIPVMVNVRNNYGTNLYTSAAAATVIPVYETLVKDTYVTEADPDVLGAGNYYFEMTCYLGNGHQMTFRRGYFTVSETLTEAGNFTVVEN